jgi:acetoin utilization deacetylase AcuC-like enzyme
LTVPVVWSDAYDIDIGLHVFPTRKYRLVREDLERRRPTLPPFDVVASTPASWDDLALVHTSEYLETIRTGTLTREDVSQLELPWSPAMVEGFRLMTGGTILAAGIAFKRSSVAVHIGGGLHHAFPNHGEGFCPFNDVAVAIRVLQREGTARHAIIDLDVHHGNGNAFIFGPDSSPDDDRVFTFSMHQQHNYPMWKPQGAFDIGLSDGVSDATYLRELACALPRVLAHRPECAFYLAGADPYEDDQLGGLRLTMEGLRARDRLVIRAVRDAGIPLVVVLAGGYARHVGDTVAIHTGTIEEALAAAS